MFEPIKLDTLVELRDQFCTVYPRSVTGARGWIRARREMPKLDPEAYIEWDKTHWRYHGEQDGWSYEHHFRPVDDPLSDLHDTNDILPMEQILAQAHTIVDSERCPQCGELHDEADTFIDTIMAANEALLDAEAYFVVTVAPRQEGEATIYEPQIHSGSQTPTSQALIETQLLHVAMQLFEHQLMSRMHDIEEPGDPEA